MPSNVIPVTVAIPALNEEEQIGECLRRLGRFAEVVVIDSGSADRTREIAAAYGARVVSFRWDGKFPKKRNWFLMSTSGPSHDWVLFLDADEWVGDSFCDEVQAAIASAGHTAFWLRYTNRFLGRPLRHGIAQRKLALFRVGRAFYERIDEDRWSRLDMEVHEHPIVIGTTGEISAPIEHRDDRGLLRFIERHRDYAQWECQRYLSLKADTAAWARLTSRQRFKYRHMAAWWYPWFYFSAAYFAKLGLLDGAAGFHYAFYKAWYFQTIRLLILAADPAPPKDR